MFFHHDFRKKKCSTAEWNRFFSIIDYDSLCKFVNQAMMMCKQWLDLQVRQQHQALMTLDILLMQWFLCCTECNVSTLPLNMALHCYLYVLDHCAALLLVTSLWLILILQCAIRRNLNPSWSSFWCNICDNYKHILKYSKRDDEFWIFIELL